MYQFHYAEAAEDRQDDAKKRERRAFDRSIQLLKAADEAGPGTREAAEAIYFTHKLWTILIEDLASEENDLPKELRAQLMSIGIWIVRECEKIRSEKTNSFQEIIMVSEALCDGLK
ncbi:MAG: flagellar biosynthesis regulator FlaF [Pseudomonadota bacterium]